jgi:hypothetical protein
MDRVTQRFWHGVEGPRRCLTTYAARSFSTIEARTWRTRHGLPLEREQELASISPSPCCVRCPRIKPGAVPHFIPC